MISRRCFARVLAVAVLLAPIHASADTARKLRRIGLLSPDSRPTDAELRDTWVPLRKHGWIEGTNFVAEYRFAEGRKDLLARLSGELVRLDVDLIVAGGTEATLAAKSATTRIPIVMAPAGDPVAMGLVRSLAQPGGNVTGYSILSGDVARKRADLLHELLPSAQRIGVMVDPTSPIDRLLREQTDAAYRKLRLQPIFIEVTGAEQLDEGLAEAGRRHVEALVATLPFTDARTVAQSAARYRLPTVVAGREMLDAGGLMSFTYNLQDLERRVAVIVDKILRGARPADVPIEQPTRFTLLINAKAAKDLGIAVPRLLLMRADEVIQ